MLGLASESGSILDSYKRYLRDSIDLNLNRAFLRIELGDLLWYIAVVSTACGLSLSEVTKGNLAKIRVRYKSRFPSKAASIGCIVPTEHRASTDISKDFSNYQFEASKFNELDLGGPDSLFAPLCGLAHATGNILKFPKDSAGLINLQVHKKFFRSELGDLLWYLSTVATASNLNLGDIAQENLARTRDLYPLASSRFLDRFKELPTLDDPGVSTECFPRRMIIKFTEERTSAGYLTATQTIVHAEPNAFPNGPQQRQGKLQGFKIGKPLGDRVDDNSRRMDGYRYHDAIHLGFMAVLGWSPTIRSLLRLKRKSKGATDRTEDGARAVFTEEGLAAILAQMAPRRMDFRGENAIDGEIIDMAKALVRNLEIEFAPGWLWRRAINQGFIAMHELEKNSGGYIEVDLDARALTYSKVRPNVSTKRRH